MKHQLSLFLTHELIDILDNADWEALHEFICLYGYDENTAELDAYASSEGGE